MMKCKFCGYDNEPLPGDSPPDRCEGCGEDLEVSLRGY